MAVWQTVQQEATPCDLAASKPQDVRRCVGTQLARANIRQAQQALGQKSIETTARHDDLKGLNYRPPHLSPPCPLPPCPLPLACCAGGGAEGPVVGTAFFGAGGGSATCETTPGCGVPRNG